MRQPAWGGLALALLAWPAVAFQRPSAQVLHLQAGESVVVDGDLSDPAWEGAVPIGALTQVEPVQGAEPTWPTEIRLAFDRDALYVAVRCFDNPKDVRARQRDRDAFVRYDDVVELWFDTFHDNRFAFWFQATAGGSLGDALISDGGNEFNKNWDGIWYGKVRRDEQGWAFELAIPFQTLVFGSENDTWGFNVVRKRVANGESCRWASPSVAYRSFQLARGGVLTGMTGMRHGMGLDAVPYVRLGGERQRAVLGSSADDWSTLGDAGLDLAWRVDPATTLRMTVNTDFAQTEVDARQINLTRFPLFFPEKRDFFLEDAGLFSFGAGEDSSLLPFFSRRIGRDDLGEAVPILAGLKLTGRSGQWNFGLLETLVDGQGQVADQSLGVARISRNIGQQSSLGMIFTHGRPEEESDSFTGGLDFRIGTNSQQGGARTTDVWGWWLASESEGAIGDDETFGVQARTRTSQWTHELFAQSIGKEFDPALGFVRRTGIREYEWSSRYTWRSQGNGPIREYRAELAPSYTTGLSGRKDSWEVGLEWLDLVFASEDGIEVGTERRFERIPSPFELGGGATIAAGDYDMTVNSVGFESNDRRWVNGEAGVEFGDFYGGDILRWVVAPVLVPGPLFTLSLEYEDIAVDLESGEGFHTNVYAARFDFSFNPELSWRNLVQYDTESKQLGLQSRWHWIVTPGQDLFFVAGLGWVREGSGRPLVPTGQEVNLKLQYTLRF